MNNKAVTLSVAFALFAVFMVHSYVSSIEEETKKKYGTELLVLIAKRDIKEMETLNETMLELKAVPKLFLEPAAISFQMTEKDNRERHEGTCRNGCHGADQEGRAGDLQ